MSHKLDIPQKRIEKCKFPWHAEKVLLKLSNIHQDFPIDSCACHIFYEHWVQMQLVISKTPLGPEDLSSWCGGWALDWIGQISDFDSHLEEQQTWMKFTDGILTFKIVFTTVVRRDIQITWSSRQGWQKTLLSRCRKRLKDLEAIHQHEATFDRFVSAWFFVQTCIEMSQRNLLALRKYLENL